MPSQLLIIGSLYVVVLHVEKVGVSWLFVRDLECEIGRWDVCG